MSWEQDQEWERNWWSTCQNTLREELLQFAYAKRMELDIRPTDRTPYSIDMHGKSVIDIGGGPCSLLLKCINLGEAAVIDPCHFPTWILDRYACGAIGFYEKPAELLMCTADEAWIYNVLQHVQDPANIVANARASAKTVRIFEFIQAGISPGHPWNLQASDLDEWLGGRGTVEQIDEHGAIGLCYYGVFKGLA